MKINQLLAVCGITAALFLGAGKVLAQNDNGGNAGGGGGRPGRGNWDPAQMQQRLVDGVRDRLNFTNDTEWAAVEPLVTKVVAARFEVGMGGMRGLMGARNRNGQNGGQGGQGGGRGGMFGQSSPEAEALQKAIDDNAPKAQIKDLLAKYETVQKAKQTKLIAAQSELRQVLTVNQEAQATLLGLLD